MLSGNDDQAFHLVNAGGDGVISVLSNVAPKETSDMMRYALQGNAEEARRLHLQLSPRRVFSARRIHREICRQQGLSKTSCASVPASQKAMAEADRAMTEGRILQCVTAQLGRPAGWDRKFRRHLSHTLCLTVNYEGSWSDGGKPDIIDFQSAASETVRFAENISALVIGTTGLQDSDFEMLRELARQVLWCKAITSPSASTLKNNPCNYSNSSRIGTEIVGYHNRKRTLLGTAIMLQNATEGLVSCILLGSIYWRS